MASQSRRKAREAALRALYQIEVGGLSPTNALRGDPERQDLPGDLDAYSEELVHGIFERRQELDRLIAPLVTDWDYSRVVAIDKNLLRIAAYEMFHVPSIPPAVSINEAVELAKKYSTAESGRFVNGILGRLLLESPKANWDASTAPAEDTYRPEYVDEPPIEEVREGSVEAEELARAGFWKLKSEDNAS